MCPPNNLHKVRRPLCRGNPTVCMGKSLVRAARERVRTCLARSVRVFCLILPNDTMRSLGSFGMPRHTLGFGCADCSPPCSLRANVVLMARTIRYRTIRYKSPTCWCDLQIPSVGYTIFYEQKLKEKANVAHLVTSACVLRMCFIALSSSLLAGQSTV